MRLCPHLSSVPIYPVPIYPEENTTMYRVWGGDPAQGGSSQFGNWLTPNLPTSGTLSRSINSLQPGNTCEYYSEVNVHAGTRIQSGTSSAAFGQDGGGQQVWLLDQRLPQECYGPGIPLKP